jgi:hypothetical protein
MGRGVSLLALVVAVSAWQSALGAEAVTLGRGEKPVKVDSIAGSAVKQVTLSARAAERLGIRTAAIPEAVVTRKWIIGGEVVAVSSPTAVPAMVMAAGAVPAAVTKGDSAPILTATGSAPVAGGNDLWVRVVLSEREAEKVAQNQPARVLPLVGGNKAAGLTARPSKMPAEARRDGAVELQYVTYGGADGMAPGKRVRLELPLVGSGAPRKTVPYGAVLYDAKGGAWVYVNNAPLTYARHKIEIDYIAGDVAILLDGPPIGAMVVTVGAALLHGAETQGK